MDMILARFCFVDLDKELAHKLSHTGDSEACAKVLDAVRDYETGNQKLAESLEQLQK